MSEPAANTGSSLVTSQVHRHADSRAASTNSAPTPASSPTRSVRRHPARKANQGSAGMNSATMNATLMVRAQICAGARGAPANGEDEAEEVREDAGARRA